MSPRRMDISSLLRDPSPPRPRPVPSLQNILNSAPPPPPRPPFLGLDALVHVASEEHRRIAIEHDIDHAPPSPSRPHKRVRGTPPRSPSPDPRFQHSSPSTRLHSSASPINNYPTLRRQLIEPTPTRSDSRPQHPPPFLPSPHSSRNISSQLIYSHHHSSPVLTPVPIDPDAMSPRYGLGPRMAGGIQVLSSDASPSPFYRSPGRDISVERFVSDSRIEHPRHDPPKLSPLSARTFSDDEPKPSPHQQDRQESVLLRERLRSRPPYFPLHPVVDQAEWPGTNEDGNIRPTDEPRRMESRSWRDVTENVSPLSTWDSHPHHASLPESSPFERNRLDPQPLSLSPILPQSHSYSQTHQNLHSTSSTSCAPESLIHDLRLEVSGTQSEHQSEHLVSNTCTPPMSSDPVAIGPPSGKSKQTPEDIPMVDTPSRQPSPVVHCAKESLETSNSPTHISILQTACRSPLQQPPPVELPAQAEQSALPKAPPALSPSPEIVPKREPAASERAMMDIDEEILSLVEDHSVCAIPTPSKDVERTSPPPPKVEQATSTNLEQGSSEAPDAPSLTSSSDIKGLPPKTNVEKDRASMPPPAAWNKKNEKDKTSLPAAAGKKKKEGTSKSVAKPKQPPKPRTKPAPKPKAKPNIVDSTLKGNVPKAAVNANARSRSASVIPTVIDDPVPEPGGEVSDREDDRLYCVCKTRYDEDRMMIACDRCDEWFHTVCVNMPDLEIDLVDQFICPPCIQKQPHLRTTWKRRCLFGLQHENPSSPEACHKPSRGAFSKYCSDDCGIKYMGAHITQWEKTGGARDRLWDSVKNAPRREGVVTCTKINRTSSPGAMDVDNDNSSFKLFGSAAQRRAEREVSRLNACLEEVVKERELMKRDLDMVSWREKVVGLASERAAKVDECGWDQRLCFGEEEWTDFGPEVLESYQEGRSKVESGDDATPPETASVMSGEWWCTGKKKCERHGGWQKLRSAEVSFDKETKEGVLLKLTAHEREIRKCIEDILYPQPSMQVVSKLAHSEIQSNGLVSERGRKKSP